MGKRYLRSIVADVQTLTASADITPVDLPVNPISHLILTILGTKNVNAGNTALGRVMVPMMDVITDMSVRHRGEQIIQGSLTDLAVMNAMIHGHPPAVGEIAYADNEQQFTTITLSFSRELYRHDEAFPATQRGNLRFHMTAGALNSLWDAMQWTLEAVELIEDTPARFLKYTTLTRSITASGRQRMPLPLGNEILGMLLFDPSDETDSTNSYAFGKVKLMKDNVEQYYAESNWENLREGMVRRLPNYTNAWGHVHAQAAADTITGEETQPTADRPPLQYGFMDFDPLRDGSFSLETAGAAQLDLDLNSDVTSGTVRMLPIELIKIPGA